MKRMNTAAVALATAGALGFGVVPAMAQETNQPQPNAGETICYTDAQNNKVEFTRQADGSLVDAAGNAANPAGLTRTSCSPAATETTDQPVVPEQTTPAAPERTPDICYLDEQGNIHAYYKDGNGSGLLVDENGNAADIAGKNRADCTPKQLGQEEVTEPTAELKPDLCYLDERGNIHAYYKDGDGQLVDENGNAADIAGKDRANCVPTQLGDGTNGTDGANGADGSSFDTRKAAKIAAGLLAAGVGTAIIVNGVKYFLNKDKQTLVPSEDRVHAEPTADEKKASDELKANNADQIAQQTGVDTTTNGASNTGAADGQRGISAATGVNKVPAGLLSLLLASILGAAAFVFGRRQLI